MHRKLLLFFVLGAASIISVLAPGCDDLITETTEITIIDYPRAEFSASPKTGCAGNLSVRFTDQSQPSNAISRWVWSFGDGDSAYVQPAPDSQFIIDYTDGSTDTSTSRNPAHVYDSAGLFNVLLIVTDTLERTATELKENFIVVGGPIADFQINTNNTPVASCQNIDVTFTNKSLGGAVEFKWLFENVDSGTVDSSFRYSPTVSFNTPGSYVVTLIANSDECNSPDTMVDSNLITIGNCPSLSFTVNGDTIQDTLCGGGQVQVDWVNEGGPIDSLLWIWGDNDSTLDPILDNPIFHTYPNTSATFSITAVAYGSEGQTSKRLSNIVRAIRTAAAAFTATPDSGAAPLEVQFSDQSDGSPQTFLWDFGDGTPTSGIADPIHTYDTAGVFTVQLIVNNQCNVPDTATGTITVTDTTGGAR